VQEVAERHETPYSAAYDDALSTSEADQVVPDRTSESPTTAEVAPDFADPTATHEVAEVHETLLTKDWESPAGCGRATSLQVRPFQLSANGPLGVPFELPVPMQDVADVHEMALMTAKVAPAGSGSDTGVHEEPLYVAAKAESPGPLVALPTAMQEVELVQDTLATDEYSSAPGLGTPSSVQTVPFQTRAKANSWPVEFTQKPTATHEVVDTHEMSSSVVLAAAAGWGAFWTAQVWPFQFSISGTFAALLEVK
jgi:hypothetical protein